MFDGCRRLSSQLAWCQELGGVYDGARLYLGGAVSAFLKCLRPYVICCRVVSVPASSLACLDFVAFTTAMCNIGVHAHALGMQHAWRAVHLKVAGGSARGKTLPRSPPLKSAPSHSPFSHANKHKNNVKTRCRGTTGDFWAFRHCSKTTLILARHSVSPLFPL